MGFRVRGWAPGAKFTDAIALEALERVVPPALIQAAAAGADAPMVRRRKLPADVALLLCLAMSLWTQEALVVVLAKLVHGLRLFWPDPDIVLASKGAISMAIDGTTEDVPDSPANVRAFGRHHSDRGASAFPQVQGVYLSECGTHAVVDAGFWPCHTSERAGAVRLLRSVGAGCCCSWTGASTALR